MRSLSFLLLLAAFPAAASDFDGSSASLLWGLPFALILLSIALGPLFFSRIWHHHFGKITAFWTLLFLTPFIVTFGFGAGVHTVAHALVEDISPLSCCFWRSIPFQAVFLSVAICMARPN